MDQEKRNSELHEEPVEFAGSLYAGLEGDVIGYAKKEIRKWSRIAFILAAAVVLEAVILAAVILM